MNRLLAFIIKYNYWFVFILLEAASIVLLVRYNAYQHSVAFSSANAVAGTVYRTEGGVRQYFGLRKANEALLERNALLEQRVAVLEQQLEMQQAQDRPFASLQPVVKELGVSYPALVINNSLVRPNNYLTLNRGSNDGIRREMGVVGPSGVVGIVEDVSDHYALVISLLNSKSNVSCKIQGSDYFGYLRWEGGDSRIAFLRDLPRHAVFNIGDTVVTSGFSTIFPEGVMVGTVDDMSDSHDGLSYQLKVRLSTDFGDLSQVRVIGRSGHEEQLELEKKLNQ